MLHEFRPRPTVMGDYRQAAVVVVTSVLARSVQAGTGRAEQPGG